MLLKYSFKPRWLMPLTDVRILSGDSKKCTLLNCAVWQMGRSSVEYLVDYSTVSSVRGKAPDCAPTDSGDASMHL